MFNAKHILTQAEKRNAVQCGKVLHMLNKHQKAWLAWHPLRTEAWLVERLRDGFHIHHIDGNHQNNSPDNLILVEAIDHARLHFSAPFMLKALNLVPLRKENKWRMRYERPAGPPTHYFHQAQILKQLDEGTWEGKSRNPAAVKRDILEQQRKRQESVVSLRWQKIK